LGVQAAQKSQELIADEFIYRKFIAQAVMLRAALYTVQKEWEKAIADYSVAAENYAYITDLILALEAYRMVGFSNKKYGNIDAAGKALATAVHISKKLPADMVKFTTFPGIIEMLLQLNHFKYISYEQLTTIAQAVYGNEWLKEIANWKNAQYEPVDDASKVMAV
jgi:tetratricopeptide (TPR) repeat protein